MTPDDILDTYRVHQAGGDTITVAWVKHPRAAAVVSGSAYKTRAVVVSRNDDRQLGVFPVTPRTKKPDTSDLWQGSEVINLNWRNDPPAKEAVSAWLAWLWQQKAKQKKYQA